MHILHMHILNMYILHMYILHTCILHTCILHTYLYLPLPPFTSLYLPGGAPPGRSRLWAQAEMGAAATAAKEAEAQLGQIGKQLESLEGKVLAAQNAIVNRARCR